ncbi:MAG: hypothetical protein MZU95_03675 [Desulfomicrobium escambiense]|nr:hypothetical protein [Desulfomicrobium escambiense]
MWARLGLRRRRAADPVARGVVGPRAPGVGVRPPPRPGRGARGLELEGAGPPGEAYASRSWCGICATNSTSSSRRARRGGRSPCTPSSGWFRTRSICGPSCWGSTTEQVAGFYPEPDSTALFILDDQPAAVLQPLLVHELVHAVQDQTVDLEALTDPELGSDRATAAQARHPEGHATLVMLEYLTEQMRGAPVDLGKVRDFAGSRPALPWRAMPGSEFPALAGAPAVVRRTLTSSRTSRGPASCGTCGAEGGRAAPFGPDLPLSTEQVLRDRTDAPVRLALTVDGAHSVHQDDLGRLEEHLLSRPTWARGRGGWRTAARVGTATRCWTSPGADRDWPGSWSGTGPRPETRGLRRWQGAWGGCPRRRRWSRWRWGGARSPSLLRVGLPSRRPGARGAPAVEPRAEVRVRSSGGRLHCAPPSPARAGGCELPAAPRPGAPVCPGGRQQRGPALRRGGRARLSRRPGRPGRPLRLPCRGEAQDARMVGDAH